MPDVKLNGLKNRLYITLSDWKQADMRTYVQHIESACKTLVSGFTCLIILQSVNGYERILEPVIGQTKV